MTSCSIPPSHLSRKRRRTDRKDFYHVPQHHKPYHICEIHFPPNFPFNALKSVDFCLGRHPSPDLLQVDGVVIPRRTETRHLGVVLSVDLRWNSHIDHLLSVTAGPVYLCQKLAYQHRLPSLAIRRFYVAFVRPRLEYCNAAWCGLTHIQALRLEKVQVRVARAIVRCPGGSRSQVLQDAGLPTLSWRRKALPCSSLEVS